jgi:hypothetical protein
MASTPLHLCHQCKKEIYRAENPWTFHQRNMTMGGKLDDVVRFCGINCIAAYFKLIPWNSLIPANGASRVIEGTVEVTADAPQS